MKSMTGFGEGTGSAEGARVSVELRSLNHRYQDVRLRLPAALADQSFFLEQLARKRLGRGRYDVGVRLEVSSEAPSTVDAGRLRGLYVQLAALRDELSPGAPLDVAALAALPEVIAPASHAPDSCRTALEQAFEGATAALDEMRTAEGAALLADLSARLKSLEALKEQLRAGSADLLAHQKERLTKRVAQLLDDTSAQLSEDRLAQEIALLADKSDITEELVRLDSHISQFRTLLSSDDAVGRKLDFLIQEMGREINTIGSKSQHAPVAHLVVEAKAELERLREQVQNVD